MIDVFEYYLRENLVRKGSVDKEEALSLIKKAIGRTDYIKSQQISEKNASFVFEDVYEAIRESSQSLMELRGYKPYSHEAVISFLRQFYSFPESDLSEFDRYRILRNKCVYRGYIVSSQVCTESLNFLVKFLPKIKLIFEKESKIKL